VPNDKKAFSEISRVLKKDGKAILEIPHDKWLRKTIEYDTPQKFGNVRQYGVDFYKRTKEFFKSQTEEIIDGTTFSIFEKNQNDQKLNFPVLLDHPKFQEENFTERFHDAINLFNVNNFRSINTYQVENLMYKIVNYNKPFWITLDDGLDADISKALPILRETNNIATSFLIPNKLNEQLLKKWKDVNFKKILDIQNHSLNHKQIFVSDNLIDLYIGDYKHANLIEVNTPKGFPIFEYKSNLFAKAFIPKPEAIDFCIEFYNKNCVQKNESEIVEELKTLLRIEFPNGIGDYEDDNRFNERIETEINSANLYLANNFKKEIFSFSFPWGLYNHSSIKKAAEKHTLITRVTPSRVNHKFNPFEIDRIEIPGSAFKELKESIFRSNPWENLEYKGIAKVAVLMTTYNRKETLADSIQSIINQTYKDWNLILVNDGGEDVSDIVKLFNDPRIKYLSKENEGKSIALNYAIKNSQSKYIAYLDDDDQYLPNHLEVLVTFLEKHTEIKFAYSIAKEVNLYEYNHQWHEKESAIRYAKQVTGDMLRYMNHIPNLCAIHERSLFELTGFYDEELKVLIDWDMYRRFAQFTNPIFINVVTAKYFRKISQDNRAKNQLTGLYFSDPIEYYNNRLRITSKEWLLKKNKDRSNIIIELTNKNKSDAKFYIAKYENFKFKINADLLLVLSCKIDNELLESIIYAERVGALVIFGEINNNSKSNLRKIIKNSLSERNYFFDEIEKFNLENIIAAKEIETDLVHFSKRYKQQNKESFYKNLNIKTKNKVSIIIPTFNNWSFTENCIKSIYSCKSKIQFEVIIVDNNSKDGTKERLNIISKKYENLKIIFNEENLGFAKANNIGAKIANYDLMLFLNNDTIVTDFWIDELVNTIIEEPTGIVGAKLLYPNSNLIQHAGVVIDNKPHKIFPYHIFANEKKDYTYANFIQEYQAVTGACLLTKKQLFEKVNGFDEEFLNGYEDVDLCFKIRELGYKVIYNPKSIIFHHESKTDGRFGYVDHNVKLLHKKWEGKIAKDDIHDLFKIKVSIIIPVYNQIEFTKKCIK
ncbi:MAG: glycosyltransferase, partial [Ignavibacteriae bacterium]|nr:glycosyltransferase [Ignavibacteriota bacterium]